MKLFVKYFLLALLWLPSLAYASLTETVRMQLSWRHQFQFAGYYAALEKGFYQKAGLSVELVEGGPGVSCNESMLLNQVQYCNGPGSMVKRRIEGESIVVLASFIQQSPVVLITLKGSGLRKPRDLVGKRVETQLAGADIPEIKAMLDYEGVKLEQLDNRENSVGVDALVHNEVDAKYAFITNEPYQLVQRGIEHHIISPRDYGIDFYGDALFTSETEILENPERVDQFLAATIKGWEYAMANKPEIARLIHKKYAPNKEYASLIAEADAIEQLMMKELIEIGHNNEARWLATAKILFPSSSTGKAPLLDGFIYTPEKDSEYLRLLWLLLICLFVAVLASLMLWAANRMMSAEIKMRAEAQHALSVANQQIRKQVYIDELTGMGNRRAFFEGGEAEIKLAKLDGKPLAALLIDIDYFKQVNDCYGHAQGDQVIQAVANSMLEMVRSNDIQGRIGGEEFAVLATNTSLAGAEDLAERMRRAVESLEIASNKGLIKVTVSIGVTDFDKHDDDIHSMLARADVALYRAKNKGRNRAITQLFGAPIV